MKGLEDMFQVLQPFMNFAIANTKRNYVKITHAFAVLCAKIKVTNPINKISKASEPSCLSPASLRDMIYYHRYSPESGWPIWTENLNF